MPKAQLHLLSAPQVDRIKASPADQMINDGGGLYLFVRKHKTKEWVFRYTSPITGGRRKQSLGSYPDTTIKEARRLAGEKRALVNQGVDPLIQNEKNRLEENKILSENKKTQSSTVFLIFNNWKKEDLQNRKDKGQSALQMFEKDVFPVIGNKPINDISRLDIKAVLDRPLNRKANRVANKLLSDLKQFFGYADDEELITQDPTRRLKKERVGGIEQSRKRVLCSEELVLLKQNLLKSDLKQIYQHAIYLYLATGCRRAELITTPIKNINIEKRNLFIPSDKSKNTDEHNIYLSDFAVTQINAIMKLTGSKWLFPNRKDDGHLIESAITKQITDRQPKELKKKNGKKLKGRKNDDSLALPNGHWIVHDLRRTTATIMQELGVMPHIIKKCLNQRTEDKIMETYQRARLNDEQKNAFILLGEYLQKTLK